MPVGVQPSIVKERTSFASVQAVKTPHDETGTRIPISRSLHPRSMDIEIGRKTAASTSSPEGDPDDIRRHD